MIASSEQQIDEFVIANSRVECMAKGSGRGRGNGGERSKKGSSRKLINDDLRLEITKD